LDTVSTTSRVLLILRGALDAGAQVVLHLAQRLGQRAHFIGLLDGQLLVEVALGDPFGKLRAAADRLGHARCHAPCHEDGDRRDAHADHQLQQGVHARTRPSWSDSNWASAMTIARGTEISTAHDASTRPMRIGA
jgi:hypothetical protein